MKNPGNFPKYFLNTVQRSDSCAAPCMHYTYLQQGSKSFFRSQTASKSFNVGTFLRIESLHPPFLWQISCIPVELIHRGLERKCLHTHQQQGVIHVIHQVGNDYYKQLITHQKHQTKSVMGLLVMGSVFLGSRNHGNVCSIAICEGFYGQELDPTAPLTDHYCADSGSKCDLKHKLAAPISEILLNNGMKCEDFMNLNPLNHPDWLLTSDFLNSYNQVAAPEKICVGLLYIITAWQLQIHSMFIFRINIRT